MQHCPSCGADADGADVCAECGAVLDDVDEELPPRGAHLLLVGVAGGVVAYLLGYALAFGAYLGQRAVGDGGWTVEGVPDVVEAGWLFYGAHNVAVAGPSAGNAVQSAAGGPVPPAVLYLLPPVVLVGTGYAAATFALRRRREQRGWVSQTEGGVVGATLAMGYVLLSGGGTAVFAAGGSAPDPVTAVLVMGVVYPLAFGGLGGVLAWR